MIFIEEKHRHKARFRSTEANALAQLVRFEAHHNMLNMDSNHVKAEDSEHFEEHEVQSGMVTDAAPQWSPLDKSIIRKTDWQVIPLIAMLYLLSFLDRANVGNARVVCTAKKPGLSAIIY